MASKSKKLFQILPKSLENKCNISWTDIEGRCGFCKEKVINNRFLFGIRAGGELIGKQLIGENLVPICVTNFCLLNKIINYISLDSTALIYYKEFNTQTYYVSYQSFLDYFYKIFKLRTLEKYKPILIDGKRLKNVELINGMPIYHLEKSQATIHQIGFQSNYKNKTQIVPISKTEIVIKKFIKIYSEIKLI